MCLFVSVSVFYVSIGGGKTGYRWGTRDLATLINLAGNQHQTTRSGGGGGVQWKGEAWITEKEKGYNFSRHIAAFARSIFVDRNHVAGLFIFRCQSGSRSDNMEIGIHLFFREFSIFFQVREMQFKVWNPFSSAHKQINGFYGSLWLKVKIIMTHAVPKPWPPIRFRISTSASGRTCNLKISNFCPFMKKICKASILCVDSIRRWCKGLD